MENLFIIPEAERRTEITVESDQAEKGDFLVLADVCATGGSQTIVAAFNPSGLCFCRSKG